MKRPAPSSSLALLLAAACALLPACSKERPRAIEVLAQPATRAALDEFVAHVPYEPLRLIESADPEADLAGGEGALRVAVVADQTCRDCYRIERAGDGYVVRGDAPLGVQYGLAYLLESLGFRFFHPWRTYVPAQIGELLAGVELDRTFEPEMSLRGLHLHTLHPIEGYFAFWEPGEGNLRDARRILDWAVKNRANYIQWVALDDIQNEDGVADAWRDHTREIVAAAHARGLRTGLGIQIFGSANLQQAFDLIKSDEEDPAEVVAERLPVILDGLGLDTISLSFGEFFGEEPAAFVAALDLVYDVIRAQAPDIEVTANIHVGDSPAQRVTYMDEDLIYYFLIKFANPEIVHWVHTVMYYNLFEDAGGAYHHDEFAEHREYLLDKLAAGERVVYFPETAYWVAFDNSVPTYLPLYVRSRWLDLAEIRARAQEGGFGALDEQVLFSTGWEWGYWQNDYTALRSMYELPPSWEDFFAEMYAPWGEPGAKLADELVAITRLQHEALIEKRLAAYLAGRDVFIDVGDRIDIVSQPPRPHFEDVVAMTAPERATFAASVLDELDALAAASAARLEAIEGLRFDAADPWYREMVDGAAVNVARTRFIAAIYRALVAHAEGAPTQGWIDEATAALALGRQIVARRHGELHHPDRELMAGFPTNATIYQFGYLQKADELCYWERELVQARRIIYGVNDAVPGCVF